MKRKHEALQRDLGGTLDLLWHIQHASATDAKSIFDRIRRGDDPATVVSSLNNVTELGRQSVALPSAGGPDSTVVAGSSAREQTSAPPGPHQDPWSTSSLSMALPDFSDPAPLAAALRSQSNVFKHAFSVFFECTAAIFHVYTQEEVNDLLDMALSAQGTVSLSTLCEACAIAAVGSRYSRSEIAPELGNYYFSFAKQLLDECIEKAPLRAMKVCALLAMCNLVNKATVAFAYIGKCALQ